MSLLGNLITQVARQAMDPNDAQRNPVNQNIQPHRTGGLGGILGSVLGGNTQPTQTNSNGFGMDDILGSVIGSQLDGRTTGAGGLGSILGSVLGGGATQSRSGGKGMLIATLMPIVLGWIQKNGGLSGALSQIQNQGFGSQAQSWMSTNQENDNLDPNQIDKLFDPQDIQQVCQNTNASEAEVRQGLAELLPEVVNQLTPEGGLDQEEQANEEINEIMQQISGSLSR